MKTFANGTTVPHYIGLIADLTKPGTWTTDPAYGVETLAFTTMGGRDAIYRPGQDAGDTYYGEALCVDGEWQF